MNTYTYAEARKELAEILDEALREGGVRIIREDGSIFVLKPVRADVSLLDVSSVQMTEQITRAEIVSAVRELRERG